MLEMSFSSFISQKPSEIPIFRSFWGVLSFGLVLLKIGYFEVRPYVYEVFFDVICTYFGLHGKRRPIAILWNRSDFKFTVGGGLVSSTPLVKRVTEKGLISSAVVGMFFFHIDMSK